MQSTFESSRITFLQQSLFTAVTLDNVHKKSASLHKVTLMSDMASGSTTFTVSFI